MLFLGQLVGLPMSRWSLLPLPLPCYTGPSPERERVVKEVFKGLLVTFKGEIEKNVCGLSHWELQEDIDISFTPVLWETHWSRIRLAQLCSEGVVEGKIRWSNIYLNSHLFGIGLVFYICKNAKC